MEQHEKSELRQGEAVEKKTFRAHSLVRTEYRLTHLHCLIPTALSKETAYMPKRKAPCRCRSNIYTKALARHDADAMGHRNAEWYSKQRKQRFLDAMRLYKMPGRRDRVTEVGKLQDPPDPGMNGRDTVCN